MSKKSPQPEKESAPTSQTSRTAPRKPRVLLVYPWYCAPGTFNYLSALSKRFVDAGYEYEVLAGVPFKGRKYLPGYKKYAFRQKEIIDGVKITRLAFCPSKDTNGLRRFVSLTSIGLSTAFATLFVERPDVVLLHCIPPTGWAATALRLLYRCKIILMVQDLWPESVAHSGMMNSRFLLGILDFWSRSVYKAGDLVVGISPGFVRKLVERGVEARRAKVVYTWSNESEPRPSAARLEREEAAAIDAARARGPASEKNPLTIAYAGNLGTAQALEVVVEAAKLLRDEPVRFRLIGDGVVRERLEADVRAANLTNVEFLGLVPKSEIPRLFADVDLSLVHLQDKENFRVTVPSKIPDALLLAKPLLCGLRGDAADLIRAANAGFTFEPQNPIDLANVVREAVRAPREELVRRGFSGRRHYWENLSLETVFRRYEGFFRELGVDGANDSRQTPRS